MVVVAPLKTFPEPLAQQPDEAVADRREFEEVSLSHLLSTDDLIEISLPLVVPDELLLGSLRDGRLRVFAPIVVKFTKEDQNVIAEAVEFKEFGFGNNFSEAMRDLQRAIVELYFTLEQEQVRLGTDLKQVREKFPETIVRRHDHQGKGI